ncbi:MAG: hypothetical protein ISR69_06065 [Gammaproteobacteria bacterium]|nr:hypothetical protein [Gammaproteobacteria bacterium]
MINGNDTDWVLCATPDLSGGGKMHIDTLSMYFDDLEINSYLDEKKKILKRLEAYDPRSKDIPDWAYLDFEQILAHEAFHVYQTLNCNFLSEYSEAKRREALVALRLLGRDIDNREKFSPSEIGLRAFYNNPKNDTESQYFEIIKKDRVEAIDKLYTRQKPDEINLFEVVEGAAVAFQLLSQNDLRNKKVPLKGNEYTKAWDAFSSSCEFDYENDEELGYARLMFLFLTDVYLKSKNVSTSAVSTFEEAIDLVVHLIAKRAVYQEEYFDSNRRDTEFIKSLRHVERDESNVESILDYCGTIDEEKQFQLYLSIRLYTDVYKRIAPVGLPEKKIALSNKNKAINYYLNKKFPFWESNFSIPCILSDYMATAKFITMWIEFSQIKFIDETRNAEISFESENFLLELYDELSVALLPVDFNKQVRCCPMHGYQFRNIAHKCTNDDSLNSRFIKVFNRSISEIIEYE